ncbi:MAG TPA: tetratricopeptide repeat protein [Cyclobacteriaceae bacterium]|nr:tetratricopeptide repeat protein [Cyclobacteriaceae bacterium]
MTANCSSDETKGLVFTTWAIINWINGEYTEALKANLDAIHIWQKHGNRKNIARNMHNIAMIHYYQSDFQAAVNDYKKCFEIFKDENDSLMMAKTLNHIALVYFKQADYKEATTYLMQSYRLREKLSGYENYTNNLAGLGSAFIDKKVYEHELEYLLTTLKNIKSENDTFKLATHYQNIGKSYYFLEDFPQSIKWLSNAFYMMKEIDFLPVWSDLGDAFLKNGDYDSAGYYYNESLRENIEKGTRIDQVISYHRLGELAAKENKYNEALQYIGIAERMNEEMNHRLSVAELNARLARIHLDNNEVDAGLVNAEKSFRIAKEINAGNVLRDVLEILAILHERRGQVNKALFYQKELYQLDHRIHDDRSMYEMALVSIQYETEKKQEEIERLDIENHMNQAKLKFQSLFSLAATGSVILLFMLAGSLYIRFRQKNQSEKLMYLQKTRLENVNKLLEASNAEKEVLLGEIHHRVKNNLQIISSLLNIGLSASPDPLSGRIALEGQNRIKAMGLIHENLYRHKEFGGVYIKNYLIQLTDNLINSFGSHSGVRIDADDVKLDIDSAIPLGLIVNELVTNAMKYGCNSRENPEIFISLKISEGKELNLLVQDNGPGINQEDSEKSFGYKLIRELTRKLNGTVEVSSSEGTQVKIKVKKFKLAV